MVFDTWFGLRRVSVVGTAAHAAHMLRVMRRVP